ncbi:MAG: NAD-dependent epimerase/dehydratase family protein [Candidatus Solibacter usitatus]|nr:NAD-dependent epimerase/dehydratase family protein [Candidatus Solibacter usitatus]
MTGRRVWVTGGLGFIGSNLALRLLELGAEVTIVDPCVEGCGGNPANLGPHLARCRIISRDIADAEDFAAELAAADVVFNLAGEISHARSQREPMRDLELNTIAQLRFLQVLTRVRPGVRIIYAGTRQVYGRARSLPVNEDHPIRPTDFNGVHKRAAENYHLMLTRMGLLDAVVLRLTNTYGPRLSLDAPGQGFLSVFLKRALLGERIEVFGDGSQLRDPVHVDDVTDAFIRAALAESPPERVFNVGGPEALSLKEIARLTALAAGPTVNITCRQFPADHLAFDIGSYQADTTRIRTLLGWIPRIGFAAGIRATLKWFEEHLAAR